MLQPVKHSLTRETFVKKYLCTKTETDFDYKKTKTLHVVAFMMLPFSGSLLNGL